MWYIAVAKICEVHMLAFIAGTDVAPKRHGKRYRTLNPPGGLREAVRTKDKVARPRTMHQILIQLDERLDLRVSTDNGAVM